MEVTLSTFKQTNKEEGGLLHPWKSLEGKVQIILGPTNQLMSNDLSVSGDQLTFRRNSIQLKFSCIALNHI